MTPQDAGRAVWDTRDRAEFAEARVKELEAEVKRLTARIRELEKPTLPLYEDDEYNGRIPFR